MNTDDFFRKIIFLKKRESINYTWKGNKMKGGNKDALHSSGDGYTVKKLNYNLNFSFNPLFS